MTNQGTIFAGGTSGSAVGTIMTNVVGSAGCKYDAASAIYGSMGAITTVGTDSYISWTVSGKVFGGIIEFTYDSSGGNQTTDWQLLRVEVAGTRVVGVVSPNTTKQLRSVDAAAANGTLSTAMVNGGRYMLPWFVNTGTSSSDGTFIAYLYDMASNAVISTIANSTAFNAGAGATITKIIQGKYGANADPLILHYHHARVDDGLTGPAPRYSPTPAATVSALGTFISNPDGAVLFATSGNVPVTPEQALGDNSDLTGVRFADCASAPKSAKVRCAPLLQGTDIVETPRARLLSGSGTTYMDLSLYQGATLIATRTGITITSTTAADFAQTKLDSTEYGRITWTSSAVDLDALITVRAS